MSSLSAISPSLRAIADELYRDNLCVLPISLPTSVENIPNRPMCVVGNLRGRTYYFDYLESLHFKDKHIKSLLLIGDLTETGSETEAFRVLQRLYQCIKTNMFDYIFYTGGERDTFLSKDMSKTIPKYDQLSEFVKKQSTAMMNVSSIMARMCNNINDLPTNHLIYTHSQGLPGDRKADASILYSPWNTIEARHAHITCHILLTDTVPRTIQDCAPLSCSSSYKTLKNSKHASQINKDEYTHCGSQSMLSAINSWLLAPYHASRPYPSYIFAAGPDNAFGVSKLYMEENPDRCIRVCNCTPFGTDGIAAHPFVLQPDFKMDPSHVSQPLSYYLDINAEYEKQRKLEDSSKLIIDEQTNKEEKQSIEDVNDELVKKIPHVSRNMYGSLYQ